MNPKAKTCLIVLAIALIACLPLVALSVLSWGPVLKALAGGLLLANALNLGPNVVDEELQVTKALPNGAATVSTDAIDLGHSSNGVPPANVELLIEAPLLAFADLGDGATMKYEVFHDTDAAFGSEVSLYGVVLTQTGAAGAGAAATSKRVALPSNVNRYLRVKATNSAGGDASDKSMTVTLLA